MSNTVSESEVNWHCCSPWNREIFNILGRHYPIVSRGGFSPVLSDAANKMASECPRVLPLSNRRETNTGADVNVAKTAQWKQKKGPEEWISNTILTASTARKWNEKSVRILCFQLECPNWDKQCCVEWCGAAFWENFGGLSVNRAALLVWMSNLTE